MLRGTPVILDSLASNRQHKNARLPKERVKQLYIRDPLLKLRRSALNMFTEQQPSCFHLLSSKPPYAIKSNASTLLSFNHLDSLVSANISSDQDSNHLTGFVLPERNLVTFCSSQFSFFMHVASGLLLLHLSLALTFYPATCSSSCTLSSSPPTSLRADRYHYERSSCTDPRQRLQAILLTSQSLYGVVTAIR